ncbi:hypothetical protein H6G33_20890 [Calothrix sp. FACHB-1219]|uniref:hypothetical protein n=1 Tax=unclassified Calothrix TaxID=2619626 RepID=UPI001681EC54|nr:MULTISPECIES: hypothetical protein [unclassified Calothrix]MBD2206358.1 hypothetical protein [Calothrix sp. FACHB-168]MBD2219475.1 hypothetical protein [Calothrix sp. FACHB-1219]
MQSVISYEDCSKGSLDEKICIAMYQREGDKGEKIFSVNSQPSTVNQFWILDLRFWIDYTDSGMQLGDFKLTILDLFHPQGEKSERRLPAI